MIKSYLLAIDQGTTSSRAIIFDNQLNVKGLGQKKLTQHYPWPGAVEQDAEEIFDTVLQSVEAALIQSGISKEEIGCIGITNQRETSILWEKKSGKPIHRAIVWQSRQSDYICEQWKKDGLENIIRAKTGLLPDAYFSASKICWFMEHIPGLRERMLNDEIAFGTVDSWLLWKLSNGKVHATDASNASRTMLMNIEKGIWDDDLLSYFNIPSLILPEIKATSCNFGTVQLPLLKNIPVMAMAGDQQSALFGQHCFSPGMAKNTYGTGCFMLMQTGDKRVNAKNGLLSTIAWQINGKLSYALEGSVFTAGAVVQWLRDELGIIQTAEETESLAESVNNTDGVYLVPAFTGLGAPYWNSKVRGTITGISRGSSKAHIVRAALESIAYQSAEIFALMEEMSGIKLKKLKVDGGASVNNFLMQFQADLLQCDVERPANRESTALGVAMLAGLETGIWKDVVILEQILENERVFNAKISQNDAQIKMEQWKNVVLQLLKSSKLA
jgi:glycerol kinase